MSEPAIGRECRMLRHVMVPMRDGVELATSVYLPPAAGRYPAVLVRTAYNRVGIYASFFPAHGLALVTQDCRGRYASEGRHYPFVSEPDDGEDTLTWIAAQPWCDGRIGMFGDSYLAAVQFLVGPRGHPALKALNPRFMADDCWKHAYYCDGAFSLGLTWTWLCFECVGRGSEAGLLPRFDVEQLLRHHRPLLTLDEASGAGVVPHYRDYLRHGQFDAHWELLRLKHQYARFTCPALLTGGWYDNYAAEAVRTWQGLRDHAPTPALRAAHRLLLGPWSHGIHGGSKLGELDFGPAATRENDATFRWLDTLLHDRAPAEFMPLPVRYFTMGVNEWRDAADWPPPGTRCVPYYLRAGGALAPAAPGAGEAPDLYRYDPQDPAPTRGGNHSIGPYNPGLFEWVGVGPYDQHPVEARADVRSYTTPPLARDLEVTGPVVVKLHASTTARDTDFVARLCDVYPDGRSIGIAEGILRARFRNDVWGQPTLLEPGRVYEFTIDLQVTSNVFRAGHCLRLDVTSSSFPLWAPNQNTGNDPATDTAFVVAEQTLYHDAARPSHVLLPVAP